MLQKEHPVYLETVTFRNIMLFTALQAAYLCAVWGVTWAGAVGIAFPFLIVLLIPGRQYVMPRLFDAWTLSQLDAAEYEQATAAPAWVRTRVHLPPLHSLQGSKTRLVALALTGNRSRTAACSQRGTTAGGVTLCPCKGSIAPTSLSVEYHGGEPH